MPVDALTKMIPTTTMTAMATTMMIPTTNANAGENRERGVNEIAITTVTAITTAITTGEHFYEPGSAGKTTWSSPMLLARCSRLGLSMTGSVFLLMIKTLRIVDVSLWR